MVKRMIGGMIIMIAGVFASGLAGCGGKGQKAAIEVDAEGQNEEAISEKPYVEIVYCSDIAAGKPAFAEDGSRQGPLKMIDGRKRNLDVRLDQVEIADIGAYEFNGRRECMLTIYNPSSDTLVVDSVLLPDNRFEAEWKASYNYFPNFYSTIALYGDEKEYVEDYKIVIVYKNEGIAPQTLHVNIHPDINKLHADYAASQAE